jgi:hypothetical protein
VPELVSDPLVKNVVVEPVDRPVPDVVVDEPGADPNRGPIKNRKAAPIISTETTINARVRNRLLKMPHPFNLGGVDHYPS